MMTLSFSSNCPHIVSSEAILTVIENFKSVLPLAKSKFHLDMSESNVNRDGHTCGTVHCHGGWYAIAALDTKNYIVDFDNGADIMARHLGLIGRYRMMEWADQNPRLWGNEMGYSMFSGKMAFHHPTKRPSGALTLKDIVDHWVEVYGRVKAIEDAKKAPAYPDITSELAVLPGEETPDVVTKSITVDAGHN